MTVQVKNSRDDAEIGRFRAKMPVFVPNVVVFELKIPIFTQFDPVVIKNLFFTWFFAVPNWRIIWQRL